MGKPGFQSRSDPAIHSSLQAHVHPVCVSSAASPCHVLCWAVMTAEDMCLRAVPSWISQTARRGTLMGKVTRLSYEGKGRSLGEHLTRELT